MSLLRASATIGGYTLISRVLGFVRDQLIAAALGTGTISDAFYVALKLPNMFRTLFAEGAFSTAFVPVFTRELTANGSDGARRYGEDALALLLAGLAVTLLLAELFTPQLVPLIAPGFADRPAQFELTVALTRVTFPYLLFIALASLQGGVLNSLHRFAAAAVTPVLLNLFQIGAVLWTWRQGDTGNDASQIYAAEALSWCVTAGGVAQFLWLMLSCARAGMALRLGWPRVTAQMKRLGGLMLPGVFGAGITQINLFISTNIASTLPAGSITFLQYGDRVNQLPLAVIGIAVGTAILPTLSRRLQAGDEAGARTIQNRGLELALLLTLPAAAALSVIAEPIFAVLFQHGKFDTASAQGSAGALAAYAWGLPAFVLIKVLVPGFYARHDTKTPVKIGAVAVAVNIALTLVLSGPLLHIGNALATTLAGWVNALALGWLLIRNGHFALDARLRHRIPRILGAAACLVLLLGSAARLLQGPLHEGPLALRVAALAALVAVGLAGYAGFALGFGASSLGDLKAMVGRQAA
ncbi:MAG: putative peptidoglycan lipid flippase [Aliidongia sp.]|nr:putative peptidoglycan lipid flippase [Aliidongia sp.]